MMTPTPHALPTGWVECTLEDLLDYEQPTQYLVVNTDYVRSGIPVLTAGKSFILGHTNETNGVFSGERLPVIIFDDFTTASKWVNFPFKVKSTAMKILNPNKQILGIYAFYAMQTIRFNSTTHKRYWISIYSKIKIPLPPLNEQRRIVAKIEALFSELENGVVQLSLTQAKLKQYRQALLKTAFNGNLTADWRAKQNSPHVERSETSPHLSQDDEGGLPVGWEEKSLGSMSHVGTGATPKRGEIKYYERGKYSWITSSAVNKEKITESKEKITDIALKETNCKLYPPETLIMAMYGEGKTRGKASLLCIEAATNQACAAIQPNREIVSILYILKFLLFNYQKIRIESSGGVQPNLNLSHVKAIIVPVPPLPEQEEIVKRLEAQFSVIDALEAEITLNLQKAETLKQAILQKAFAGQLVPQNPTDEPASELLQRIQAEKATQAKTPHKKKATTT